MHNRGNKCLTTFTATHFKNSDGGSTLTIEYADSACSGQYSVSVDSDAGKCTSSGNVNVVTQPGTPMDLSAKLQSESTVHLKWSHPFRGGSDFLWYTVQYRRDGLSPTGHGCFQRHSFQAARSGGQWSPESMASGTGPSTSRSCIR